MPVLHMHLTITKEEGRKPMWRVSHVPTNRSVGCYSRAGTAKAVVKAMVSAYGGLLGIVDENVLVSAMRDRDAPTLRWIVRADDYPDRAQWDVYQAQVVAEKAAMASARESWVGLRFYFGSGMRYGKAGTIVSVDKLDPPVQPEAITCCVEWSPTCSTLGAVLYIEDIVGGEAPNDLPWYEIRRGHEWRARIAGSVYVIGAIGDGDTRRYGLWTEDLAPGACRLPEYTCEFEYPTLEAAKVAARSHATSAMTKEG